MSIKILAEPSKKLFADSILTSKSTSGALAYNVVIDVTSTAVSVISSVEVSWNDLANVEESCAKDS